MMQDRRRSKTFAGTWPVSGPSDYMRLMGESVATYFSFWNVWTAFGRKCVSPRAHRRRR